MTTTQELYEIARELGQLWSIPDLHVSATLEFSDRLSTSLGRCMPARRVVRLHAGLRSEATDLVREVLSHELAHLAVYLRFGRRAKPHGEEWQHLMSLAGFEPQRRAERVFPRRSLPLDTEASPSSGTTPLHYEHRCPVCQSVRIARTATPRWRCTECVADGLEGSLVVTELSEGGS